jgi:hypothetical protein
MLFAALKAACQTIQLFLLRVTFIVIARDLLVSRGRAGGKIEANRQQLV